MFGSFWFPGLEQKQSYPTSSRVTFALAKVIKTANLESPKKVGYLDKYEDDTITRSLVLRGDIGQTRKDAKIGEPQQNHVTIVNDLMRGYR